MLSRCRWFLLVAAVLCLGGGPASDKKGDADQAVEVVLVDGSIVNLTLVTDTLDVMTKFGKLTVATKDILRIEFANRLPDGLGKKIDDALARLGSSDFKQREDATEELFAIGPHAWPAVVAAAKSTDQEVSRRAKELLGRMREKYPADRLRNRANDGLETIEFPISGRIQVPSLKARNRVLGEVTLQLAEVRSIRWLNRAKLPDGDPDAAK